MMIIRICFIAIIVQAMGFSVMLLESSDWPKIKEAITQGDAQKLSDFFAPSMTLSLPDYKGNFSAKQARLMMRDFFDKNPPLTYTVKNNGTTGRSSVFYLGTYTSSNKCSFAMYLLLENSNGKQTITQISIERN